MLAEGRLALGDNQALALVESSARGLIVMAVNARAQKEGVQCGQVLADARARLPGLMTLPAERESDRAGLRQLAEWCGRYGPYRNVEGEDGLWIDASGVAHLFGGEQGLLDDILCRLGGFGLTVRVAMADTPGAAFALARFGCDGARASSIAQPGRTPEALADLPVEALRLDAQSVLLLKRLGLRRIGQLYAVPREALARRFRGAATGAGKRGAKRQTEALRAAGEVVLRLDQALGERVEMRKPLAEPPVHMVRHRYSDPLISTDGIEAEARRLLDALCQALEAGQEGVRRLRFTLYRSDGTHAEVLLGTSAPQRDAGHLYTLLHEKIVSLDAGFGVDMMMIEAVQVAGLDGHQTALHCVPDQSVDEVPAALIDTLSNRLGAECVRVFAAHESHVPERAWRQVPALAGDAREATAVDHHVKRQPLRPPFLLTRPERLEVMAIVPDGPPLRFTWRRVARRVVSAEGPERIAPEWWRGIGVQASPGLSLTRDYYRVEDEHGTWYWVFRAGLYERTDEMDTGETLAQERRLPAWFMHGLFA